MAEAQQIIPTFARYSTIVKKYIDAVSIQLTRMVEPSSRDFPKRNLNADELVVWDAIERKMVRYVREMKWFAQSTQQKFRVIENRVGNRNYTSMRECYDGFNPTEASERMNQLRILGIDIIEDVRNFRTSTGNRLPWECREKLLGVTSAVV
mmetsp:Transcript_8496/g.9875  ORF Transcript_8496/g.9875 Transcript_8496/m.9875 type:complete len:151 (+) Transcript_8496:106-558(+)